MNSKLKKKINDLVVREYPIIPDKLSFSISEAAALCLVEAHVLRYWEKQFNSFKPQKINGRRYFSKKDILSVRHIRDLLYIKNFTIEGARAQILNNEENISSKFQTESVKTTIVRLEAILKNLSIN